MIDREYIILEELKARPENKKFFEILADAPDRGTFVDQWNKYALSKEAQALEDGLNFSRFKFDDDPETVKCFRFLCFEYLEEIKESLGDHIWNFRGLIFPSYTLFSRTSFIWEADFSNTKFTGNTDFGFTIFNAKADFHASQFNGSADFEKAKFERLAWFFKTKFKRDVEFSSTQFNDKSNFFEAQFNSSTIFNKAKFDGSSVFYSAEFNRGANFDRTKFYAYASFDRASFTGETCFKTAQFKGETSFSNAQFLDGAIFNDAVFEQRASFKNLHTKLKLKLSATTFHKEIYISFRGTAEVICQDTVFNGYTSLDITNCQKLPNFAAAHFNNTQHLKITDNRFEGKDDARFAVTQRDKQEKETHKPVDTYRFLKNYYAKDNHLKAKHAYFKLELKHTFRLWYQLYNLVSDCGLSVWRPLLFLMLGCLFAYCITQYLEAANCWQGGNILIRTINPLYFKCHEATNILSSLGLVAHTLWNGLMLFLIGLGLRNKLKLKH